MKSIVLSKKEYRDRVYACWLGKNIGGTIGGPLEGKMYVHNLEFYEPIPDKSAPNDDLDLQIIWLIMMEEKGIPPRLSHFAEYWRTMLYRFPWDEYGFCLRNLDRGLRPPISGWFENYYVDNMGSPIRSEIWACLAPADPQKAAAMAWLDSALDHAGGEGTWGEMFWAAVQSAAFVEKDPLTLIRIGLSMIPPSTEISRSIREAVWCWENRRPWGEARNKLATIYGNPHPCHAPQNHGFTIIGWLYGKDFGDKLCKAVNCGCDTDCTGATLGALLGILNGTRGISRKWSDPVGREIVLHKLTGNPPQAPKTLDELTDRTMVLAEKMMRLHGNAVRFGAKNQLPADLAARLFRNEDAIAARNLDVNAAAEWDGEVEIVLHYNGDPVMLPGVPRRVSVSWESGGKQGAAAVSLRAPAGWKMTSAGPAAFDLSTAKPEDRNELTVSVRLGKKTHTATFVMLGPNEAKGYPSAKNVERCWKCGVRKEYCQCPKV